jgi:hypothetical protein
VVLDLIPALALHDGQQPCAGYWHHLGMTMEKSDLLFSYKNNARWSSINRQF